MSRLIYISAKPPLPSGEIFEIQQQAMRNNARDELTGVLLFNRTCFLQCLEGERVTVTRTFTVIAADDRHHRVELLSMADTDRRAYPDWSMGLLDVDSPAIRVVLDEVVPGGLLPANLSGENSRLLLDRLRGVHLTRRTAVLPSLRPAAMPDLTAPNA
ncbi:hypothetical protein Acsp01_35690 [Actinoplanes sp. NBRC 101535]|nr:hypothetical protein Acsp01_35690 [Actinoplanes sp. NBRC 101535]